MIGGVQVNLRVHWDEMEVSMMKFIDDQWIQKRQEIADKLKGSFMKLDIPGMLEAELERQVIDLAMTIIRNETRNKVSQSAPLGEKIRDMVQEMVSHLESRDGKE